jgi:hypothetical protein
LGERAALNHTRKSRRDLLVLQTLSGVEMISKTIEAMLNEGALFTRSKWLPQKTRRAIIVRLAFLFQGLGSFGKSQNISQALQNILNTMTKSDDWGSGKETPGNTFVQFVKGVFEALGITDNFESGALSGTTIRKDILAAVEEFKK